MLLLALAKGDAYGASFEYAPADFVAKNNDLTAYRQHPTHEIAPGVYTDDTQMSIAVALALLSGQPLTRELFAHYFVGCFKRDERVGYARRFQEFLESVDDAEAFLREIKPASDKSGAAMRAPVIGLLPKLEDVIAVTTMQAKITHDTPDGINAAVAAALMTHYFVYQLGPRTQLGKWLEKHVPGEWSKTWTGSVGQKGWMSVRAAITAIENNTTLSGVLKQCVAFTGDVDTVAAVALAAAAQSVEIDDDLPAFLSDEMENDKYGRDYLVSIDEQLVTLQHRLAHEE